MAKHSLSNVDLIREVESLRRRLSRYEAVESRSSACPTRDRDRQDRFHRLHAECPLPYQSLDEQGCFLDVNPRWLEVLGYTREDVLGRWFGDFLPEHEREAFRERFERFKTVGEVHAARLELARQDGTLITAEFEGRASYDERGRFLHTHCIFQDATARKEWEEALRSSERRYRMLIEAALDGICVFDFSGRLTEVNDSYCVISGYSRAELLRMAINDVDAIESPEQTWRRIQHLRETGEARFETKHRRKDGTLIEVEVAAKLLDPKEGRIVAFVRDVTERRRFESRIRERETALLHAGRLSTLGEMASGIAHELNQPLAAILTYGDASLRLTRARLPDVPRIARNLEEIVLQGERAGVIIRRMRALAKGHQSRLASTDLNEAVRNAVALVRWEMAQNGMELRLEMAEALPPVYADAIQIEQVLLNLIRNAIDAMGRDEEGPQVVTVRTMASGDGYVQAEVCDSGVGLPAGSEDRLFEPFFTTKPDGLGIGLSISHSIIEAHQGTLGARANPDRGATFFFTLPVQRRAAGQ